MKQPRHSSNWLDVVMIRHATTDWNEAGRIQGTCDISLNPNGRAEASSWKIEATGFRWISSPLKRALDTAHLMGASGVETEPRLTEMSWGSWEGRTLVELRAELGPTMTHNEAKGLDFLPAGGESPREVLNRLRSWIDDVSKRSVPCIAVTHKGVIRALLAEATGWDMTGKSPCRLNWKCAHRFQIHGRTGEVRLFEPNLSLVKHQSNA